MSNVIELVKGLDKSVLKGTIDMHIHTSPDIRKRKFNDIEIAKEAKAVGAKAIIIKSHVMSTVERAIIASSIVDGIEIYGGVALNKEVGGLNIHAVKNAINMGGKIVWLPTASSSHQLHTDGKTGGIETIVDGKVVNELVDILKLIAERDVVLATGHLSPDEQLILVDKAKELGVNKIVINHPELTVIDMSLSHQKKLLEYGVFFERCYTCNLSPKDKGYKKNQDSSLEAIKELGFESTILSSDLGQVVNPDWSDAMAEYIHFLLNAGLTQDQIDVMTKKNPSSLIGI